MTTLHTLDRMKVDTDRLGEVGAEAFERAKSAPKDARRWANAVNKATEYLIEGATWHMRIEDEDDVLLIVSPQGDNKIYEVTERNCEEVKTDDSRAYCKAFERGEPCWHRAARKLLQLYCAE